MPVLIKQQPLYGGSQYGAIPVGQQIIFTIGNNSYVNNFFNLKFVAEVHISTSAINLAVNDDLVATFKTTPNNKGRGIFDFQPLLESYVSADNLGGNLGAASQYKAQYSYNTPHPIHLIDKLSRNAKAMRYFAITFSAEGSSTATDPVATLSGSQQGTEQYTFFNGVLKRENWLTLSTLDRYGYNLSAANLYTAEAGTGRKFLTNAPTTQYANIDDYGTFAMLYFLPTSTDSLTSIHFEFYNSAGVNIGSSAPGTGWNNGGAEIINGSETQLLYVGCFPANLRNWNSTFQGIVNTVSYYTVQGFKYSVATTELYTIKINCPDLKGYEPIRLTWLNQWGVWDYYTFTKKSVRSTSTNRTTYTQSSGTWNKLTFQIDGYKGGRKNFRVNSTERIKVNTDFVNEDDAVWFEELLNSTEVYILNGFDADESSPYNTITNKYVEPVLITTSSYIRKTIANDKLIKYTFEMERNKTERTQTA